MASAASFTANIASDACLIGFTRRRPDGYVTVNVPATGAASIWVRDTPLTSTTWTPATGSTRTTSGRRRVRRPVRLGSHRTVDSGSSNARTRAATTARWASLSASSEPNTRHRATSTNSAN